MRLLILIGLLNASFTFAQPIRCHVHQCRLKKATIFNPSCGEKLLGRDQTLYPFAKIRGMSIIRLFGRNTKKMRIVYCRKCTREKRKRE